MRQQEASAGVEHQLNDVMALSVRYVHKQIDRAIEDTGSLAPDGSEIYIIANPGEGLTQLASTNPNVALPKPERDYDSVELAAEKRLANNWYLRLSYLWSRLHGKLTLADPIAGQGIEVDPRFLLAISSRPRCRRAWG
jgi:hypothetical protein